MERWETDTLEAQVKKMIERTVSTFGSLDAAFNNAGVQSLAVETADSTSEEFDRVHLEAALPSGFALHQ